MNNCFNIARTHDPDRFLIGLFMPRRLRDDIWPIITFNFEVAKTAEIVSEPMMGNIRLQWWREAIEEIYNGDIPRKHEVVEPLAAVIKKHDLNKDDFLALINVREFDLEYKMLSDWDSFEIYARKTNAPLNKLVLDILGDEEEAGIVNQISFYYGAIGLLRAIAFHLNQRRLFIPQDVLDAHDVSLQKILDFNKFENLPKAVMDVLERLKPLQSIKPKTSYMSKVKKTAMLYHTQLKKAGGNFQNIEFNKEPAFKALRLFLNK